MDKSYTELELGETSMLQKGYIKIPITYVSITSDSRCPFGSKCIWVGELCVCLYDGRRYHMLEFTPQMINKFDINIDNTHDIITFCICAIVPLFKGMNDICLYAY